MKTYLFYDIETSGLNPVFDQILTFACIRTDPELNEIDRLSMVIRLRKDIVPSPEAFLTHGLTYNQLESGINEYKAALKIHKILNTPGTISIGYNSLGFDDEFLRFTFYRNLLNPYSHQYAKGCGRMDILPITIVYKLFHPESIKWPQIEKKPSLKLDLISRENNFVTSGRAHEAMSDVEAVIQLSRKFFKQNDIWKYCLDFFNKTRDEVRINNIKKDVLIQNIPFKIGLLLSSSFGSKVNYMAPAIYLGPSLAYKNQFLWLRLDSEDIPGLDTDIDLKDTFVTRKRPGDALIVLPPLKRFKDKLPENSQYLARENLKKIKGLKKRFFDFVKYHQAYKYPFIPNLDSDATLYQDGFFSFQEKKDCEKFHMAGDDMKKNSLDKIKTPRINNMARRILMRNFSDTIGHADKAKYHFYMNRLRSSKKEDQIIGYKNDHKFNCSQGLEALKQINETLLHPDSDQKEILEWLASYITNL